MKIASYNHDNHKSSIGGAQIPARAFKKWCDILGVECELLTSYHSPEYLNKNFDAVFFSTLGAYNQHMPFKYRKLKIPFVVMIHAEFDLNLYNLSLVKFRDIVDIARALIVIGDGYWGMDNEIFWHPCTLPEYLIKDEDEVPYGDKQGLLYAARLSTWKNSAKLAAYSHLGQFMLAANDIIDVYGEFNDQGYKLFVENMDPEWDRIEGAFDIEDFEAIKRRNSMYKLFWDVSGTANYQLEIKRLNLAAFEAMKFGVVPMVDIYAVPNEVRNFAIDYRSMRLYNDMKNADPVRMFDVVKKSKTMNYNAVKLQVENIIGALM